MQLTGTGLHGLLLVICLRPAICLWPALNISVGSSGSLYYDPGKAVQRFIQRNIPHPLDLACPCSVLHIHTPTLLSLAQVTWVAQGLLAPDEHARNAGGISTLAWPDGNIRMAYALNVLDNGLGATRSRAVAPVQQCVGHAPSQTSWARSHIPCHP